MLVDFSRSEKVHNEDDARTKSTCFVYAEPVMILNFGICLELRRTGEVQSWMNTTPLWCSMRCSAGSAQLPYIRYVNLDA